jgi:two-component system phosphate regulon sensor histidine kinase PhoR
MVVALPYVLVTVERHQVGVVAERLLGEARAFAQSLPWTNGPALDAECRRLAAALGVRVTVIAPDGAVLGESERSSETLGNHSGRSEVRDALATGTGHAVRTSGTVGERLVYAAWRQTAGTNIRLVRLATPLDAVEVGVWQLVVGLATGLALAAALGLGAALLLSRRMLRRIQRLVDFARELGAGGGPSYLAPERNDDLGLLEGRLAEMAADVAATIGRLRIEQERLEAILRGMVEGVLVTDLGGNVVLMNARARALLALPPGLAERGRPLVELARDPGLAELMHDLAGGASIASRDVVLGSARTLQVNAARLRDADGRVFGFVLVLHDVTELRRLEVVRRDFVANVSHELRTPLTAIKGYAETLLGPAGDDRETARRFLTVIDRHSERLGRLIDDLLTLSDLELGRTALRIAPLAVGAAVDDVLQILGERFNRAGVTVEAEIAPGTPAVLVDGDRLRQVLINLVDNAVKYTPAGGRIAVRAAPVRDGQHRGMVEIAVEDTGIGIPTGDLPRLTERFFRVDKARSRELGGTGLGLAIVKHIVQAHGGVLEIVSTLGHGTVVRTYYPSAPAAAAASAGAS